MSRFFPRALALLCVTWSLHAYAAPTRQDLDEAAAHFKRGVTLHKEGNYRAALIEFSKAQEIAPNYRVLYNVGQSSLEVHDYPAALRAFQRYLDEGGAQVAPARREEVTREVARLSALVAHAKIAVNKEGAEVAIDDIVIGKSPVAEQMIGPGRHKFSAQLAPLPPIVKIVDVASGENISVQLDISDPTPTKEEPRVAPLVVPPAPPPAPKPPPAPEPPSRAPFYVGLVTTGVLAAGTSVLGLMTLGARSDLEGEVDRFGLTRDAQDSAQQKVATYSLVTDILGAAAITSAIVTGVLFFVTSPTTPKNASLRPGPTFHRGGFAF
jgi:hypothetical protein